MLGTKDWILCLIPQTAALIRKTPRPYIVLLFAVDTQVTERLITTVALHLFSQDAYVRKSSAEILSDLMMIEREVVGLPHLSRPKTEAAEANSSVEVGNYSRKPLGV